MRVLQINTTYGLGSTGRIVAGIDNLLKNNGIESYVGYGYGDLDDSHHFKIINKLDSYLHNILSRIFDGQGLFTYRKTKRFVKWIDQISPDVIHLHNIHGNFLNYKVLFDYIKKTNCKVIWTLHDCWTFTGHCAYFDIVACNKWKIKCQSCPQKNSYPPSFIDRSLNNFTLKKELFTSITNRLILVPVSNWLSSLLKDSFFSDVTVQTIHNGINIHSFTPQTQVTCKPYILGVAAVWDKRKGMNDFFELRKFLNESIDIVLVGVSNKQIKSLPPGIIGLERTNSIKELAALYSNAIAIVNPTYEDNYPTVNLESISCGTPVITYNTGGSPESVDSSCGFVVNKGDIYSIVNCINEIIDNPIKFDCDKLRKYALEHFDEKKCFAAYLELYKIL